MKSVEGAKAHRRSHIAGNYRYSLKGMIAASGLPLTEVASRIGVCRSSLHKYLRGDRPVPLLVMNAMDRFRLIAEIRRVLDTSRHDRPLRRGPFLALLGGYADGRREQKPASKPPRPMAAKAVKPARKKVYRNKTYDRDVRYVPPVRGAASGEPWLPHGHDGRRREALRKWPPDWGTGGLQFNG